MNTRRLRSKSTIQSVYVQCTKANCVIFVYINYQHRNPKLPRAVIFSHRFETISDMDFVNAASSKISSILQVFLLSPQNLQVCLDRTVPGIQIQFSTTHQASASSQRASCFWFWRAYANAFKIK